MLWYLASVLGEDACSALHPCKQHTAAVVLRSALSCPSLPCPASLLTALPRLPCTSLRTSGCGLCRAACAVLRCGSSCPGAHRAPCAAVDGSWCEAAVMQHVPEHCFTARSGCVAGMCSASLLDTSYVLVQALIPSRQRHRMFVCGVCSSRVQYPWESRQGLHCAVWRSRGPTLL